MNSTTGWGEAWGTPGVSLTAGIVLWEMSKMNWSTAGEISGRAYPIPSPSRCWRPSQQHLPGTAPGTDRKTHPCASSCSCLAAFQLLFQARPVGALHRRGLARATQLAPDPDPAHREVLAAACREKMQFYPADLEPLLEHEVTALLQQRSWETGNKNVFFFLLNNICPRAQIMHWNEELSRQVGGNLFNIFSAACWPSLSVGCV